MRLHKTTGDVSFFRRREDAPGGTSQDGKNRRAPQRSSVLFLTAPFVARIFILGSTRGQAGPKEEALEGEVVGPQIAQLFEQPHSEFGEIEVEKCGRHARGEAS